MKKAVVLLFSLLSIAVQAKDYRDITFNEFADKFDETYKIVAQGVVDDYGDNQYTIQLLVITTNTVSSCTKLKRGEIANKMKEKVAKVCQSTIGDTLIKPFEETLKENGLL